MCTYVLAHHTLSMCESLSLINTTSLPTHIQSSSPSSAVGGAASGYDYLKPRPPAPVPPIDTTAPQFMIHPSTNPYVETPTAKSLYDIIQPLPA